MTKIEKIKVAVYETSEVAIATLITNDSQKSVFEKTVEELLNGSDSIVDKRCAKMSALITMINDNIL